jgi:hypothetical protein
MRWTPCDSTIKLFVFVTNVPDTKLECLSLTRPTFVIDARAYQSSGLGRTFLKCFQEHSSLLWRSVIDGVKVLLVNSLTKHYYLGH